MFGVWHLVRSSRCESQAARNSFWLAAAAAAELRGDFGSQLNSADQSQGSCERFG